MAGNAVTVAKEYTFIWEGTDRKGQRVKGQSVGPSESMIKTQLRKQGVKFDIMTTSFFLGRRTVVRAAHPAMPRGLDGLFIWMMKNAANPTDFFRIPAGRVVEMGAQVTL